jgi:hypothetical protein
MREIRRSISSGDAGYPSCRHSSAIRGASLAVPRRIRSPSSGSSPLPVSPESVEIPTTSSSWSPRRPELGSFTPSRPNRPNTTLGPGTCPGRCPTRRRYRHTHDSLFRAAGAGIRRTPSRQSPTDARSGTVAGVSRSASHARINLQNQRLPTRDGSAVPPPRRWMSLCASANVVEMT